MLLENTLRFVADTLGLARQFELRSMDALALLYLKLAIDNIVKRFVLVNGEMRDER